MTVIGILCLTLALVSLTSPGSAIADQVPPRNDKAISLTGCLTGSSEKGHQLTVMTTSPSAPVVTTSTVYRLTAIPPTADVKTHENHRVTVTGWLTRPASKGERAAGPDAKPSTVMDVRVKEILHVANSCK